MKLPNPFILLNNGTALTTWLATRLWGSFVGVDAFGNRYYKKPAKKAVREKRWVVYNGSPEPSKVPPEWHGWLHYTVDSLPDQRGIKKHVWQKQAQPNLTGTKAAYLPQGHLSKTGVHAKTVAQIETWNPN